MKVIKLSILCLLTVGLSHMYAQDVITLKSGEEIKAKVTEISASEIKYKRFDNLNGPVIVIPKSSVFAINYENGTREVINTIKSDTSRNVSRSEQPDKSADIRGAHRKNYYTGIFADLGGFILDGPRVGAELTFARHVIVEPYVRFPSLGFITGYYHMHLAFEYTNTASNLGGIGFGLGAKYFTGWKNGGIYAGPIFEYWTMKYVHNCEVCVDRHFKGSGVIGGLNLGYKFQFSSGLYLRAGGIFGFNKDKYYEEGVYHSAYSEFYYSLDLGVGFNF